MSDEAHTIRVSSRVRVTSEDVQIKGDWKKHPHAGKTGVVTELLGVVLTGPDWPARAMVRLDDGTGIAIVSLKFLEPTS